MTPNNLKEIFNKQRTFIIQQLTQFSSYSKEYDNIPYKTLLSEIYYNYIVFNPNISDIIKDDVCAEYKLNKFKSISEDEGYLHFRKSLYSILIYLFRTIDKNIMDTFDYKFIKNLTLNYFARSSLKFDFIGLFQNIDELFYNNTVTENIIYNKSILTETEHNDSISNLPEFYYKLIFRLASNKYNVINTLLQYKISPYINRTMDLDIKDMVLEKYNIQSMDDTNKYLKFSKFNYKDFDKSLHYLITYIFRNKATIIELLYNSYRLYKGDVDFEKEFPNFTDENTTYKFFNIKKTGLKESKYSKGIMKNNIIYTILTELQQETGNIINEHTLKITNQSPEDISNWIYANSQGGREFIIIKAIRLNDSMTNPNAKKGDIMTINGKLNIPKKAISGNGTKKQTSKYQYTNNGIIRVYVNSIDKVNYRKFPDNKRIRSFKTENMKYIKLSRTEYQF